MAKQGRGNQIPQSDRLRILELYAEEGPDGRGMFTYAEIGKIVNCGGTIVRRVVREEVAKLIRRHLEATRSR